jgi:hypothetical protein
LRIRERNIFCFSPQIRHVMATGSIMRSVALLLGFFVFTVPDFAVAAGYTPSFDLSPAALGDTTPAGIAATFNATPFYIPTATDNNALISQDGTVNPNIAYIEQSGGTGNFAAILQDGAGGSHNTAVYQTGSYNSAVIYQH